MNLFFEYDEDGNRHLSAWLDLLVTLLVAFVAANLLRTFVVDTYEVPTGSMLETIQEDDRVLGDKFILHLRAPRAGEIITFADPERPNVTLIKRVIATGGQVIDLRGGQVYVDGELRVEPYVNGKPTEPLARHGTNLDADITYPHEVAQGCVWVMGDNRTDSFDSRGFGDVEISAVSSHAVLIFWPFDHAGAL